MSFSSNIIGLILMSYSVSSACAEVNISVSEKLSSGNVTKTSYRLSVDDQAGRVTFRSDTRILGAKEDSFDITEKEVYGLLPRLKHAGFFDPSSEVDPPVSSVDGNKTILDGEFEVDSNLLLSKGSSLKAHYSIDENKFLATYGRFLELWNEYKKSGKLFLSKLEKTRILPDSEKPLIISATDLLKSPHQFDGKRVKLEGVIELILEGGVYLRPSDPINIPDFISEEDSNKIPRVVNFGGWSLVDSQAEYRNSKNGLWEFDGESVELNGSIHVTDNSNDEIRVEIRRVTSIRTH